jgi:hypothetical protein
MINVDIEDQYYYIDNVSLTNSYYFNYYVVSFISQSDNSSFDIIPYIAKLSNPNRISIRVDF